MPVISLFTLIPIMKTLNSDKDTNGIVNLISKIVLIFFVFMGTKQKFKSKTEVLPLL